MARVLDLKDVDGVKVITQQPAYGHHPRWRDRIVQINGVTTLLLADGSEVHACNTCGRTFGSVQSVVGHMPTHTKEPGPATPIETIKAVLRAVKSAERDGAQYPMIAAAEALNDRGILTVHDKPWTRGAVASIWNRYNDKYTVRVPRQRRVVAIDAPESPKAMTSSPFESPRPFDTIVINGQTPSLDTQDDRMRRFSDLQVALDDLAGATQTIDASWSTMSDRMRRIETLLSEVYTLLHQIIKNDLTDSDIVEKAKRYDEIVAHLLPGQPT